MKNPTLTFEEIYERLDMAKRDRETNSGYDSQLAIHYESDIQFLLKELEKRNCLTCGLRFP